MRKNDHSILKVVGVMLLALLAFFAYRNTHRTDRFSTGVTVSYEREVTNSSSKDVTGSSSEQSATSDTVATDSRDAEEASEASIKKLRAGNFSSMFKREHNVTDYYNNSYRSAYVLYGGGLIMDTFTKPVTLINDGTYSMITGKVVLSGDDDTRNGIQTGEMRIVLLDMNDRILQESDVIRPDTDKTSIIEFDIEDLKEFKIAVKATDGRAGGEHMKLIVTEDLVAVK